jgi:hypothetical protein
MGAARMLYRHTSGPNTSRCGGSRRSDNRQERKVVGSWVGGFEVGLANLSRRQVRPQGNPRWTFCLKHRRHRFGAVALMKSMFRRAHFPRSSLLVGQ